MGYRTTYTGEITFDKNNKKLVWLLKYLQKLNNCEWISSSSKKNGSWDWYHPEDEWIGYNAHLDCVNFKKGIIESPEHEFKDYEETTLILCWIIAKIDKTAKGELSWCGEEVSDYGEIKISNGEIDVSQPVLETKRLTKIEANTENYFESKTKKKIPKHNFLNLIKERNLNEKTIKEHIIMEAI